MVAVNPSACCSMRLAPAGRSATTHGTRGATVSGSNTVMSAAYPGSSRPRSRRRHSRPASTSSSGQPPRCSAPHARVREQVRVDRRVEDLADMGTRVGEAHRALRVAHQTSAQSASFPTSTVVRRHFRLSRGVSSGATGA